MHGCARQWRSGNYQMINGRVLQRYFPSNAVVCHKGSKRVEGISTWLISCFHGWSFSIRDVWFSISLADIVGLPWTRLLIHTLNVVNVCLFASHVVTANLYIMATLAFCFLDVLFPGLLESDTRVPFHIISRVGVQVYLITVKSAVKDFLFMNKHYFVFIPTAAFCIWQLRYVFL